MKGDFHIRFCERLKLKCFGLLDQAMNPLPSAILNHLRHEKNTVKNKSKIRSAIHP